MRAIWNSYSKSLKARTPRMMNWAFCALAKSTSRPWKVVTSTWGRVAVSSFSMATRSSTLKAGDLAGLWRTATTSLSTSFAARWMRSQ